MNLLKKNKISIMLIAMISTLCLHQRIISYPCKSALSFSSVKKGDVFKRRQEVLNTEKGGAVSVNAWAIRLDFLSALKSIGMDEFGHEGPSMVVYNNSSPSGHMKIAGQAIGGVVIAGQAIGGPIINNTFPAAAVIESTDGSVPFSVRWADTPQNSSAIVSDDGTGLLNLQRGHFTASSGYAVLDNSIEQQRRLWIVPNVDSTGVLLAGASSLFAEISDAIDSLPDSVSNIMKKYYATKTCDKP